MTKFILVVAGFGISAILVCLGCLLFYMDSSIGRYLHIAAVVSFSISLGGHTYINTTEEHPMSKSTRRWTVGGFGITAILISLSLLYMYTSAGRYLNVATMTIFSITLVALCYVDDRDWITSRHQARRGLHNRR